MTVLDTFYLLFKNDAGTTKKDIAGLETQIDSLRAKGRKRSEEETKQLKESTELHKKLNQQLKETQSTTDKIIEQGAAAIAGVVGYTALKSGIANVNQFNAGLYTMSKITGQNINQLQTLGNLAASAGGSKEGALADIQSNFQTAASRGVTPGPFADFLRLVHNQIRGLSKGQQVMRAGEAGIHDAGFLRAVMGSDEEFEKFYRDAQSVSAITEEIGEKAQKTEAALSRVAAAQQGLWSKLATAINPALGAFFDADAQNGGVATGAANVGAGVIGGVGALKLLKGLLGGGGAATGAAGAGEAAGAVGLTGGAFAAAVAAIAAAAAGLVYGASAGGEWIGGKLRGGGSPGAAPKSQSDFGFWTSRGYTPDQAAGIMANMHRESAGDPNARGDGGKAVGLFQWHPDRAANILKNTGIDVRTASYQQQMEAAAWEMQNGRPGFSDSHFRKLSGAAAAGYFSDKFESPANPNEAIIRGQMAIGLASQYSGPAGGAGSSQSMSIKIDKIEVKTNATDANGIAQSIKEEMSSVLRSLQGNFDDGEFA